MQSIEFRSVIIQQALTKDATTLFLLPDGFGSPFSYIHIARMRKDLGIIGLISPFRKDSSRMLSYSLQSLVTGYLREIRCWQPIGPYSLGGCSTGGVLAYAAATQLLSSGEVLAHLVLIDSPSPKQGLDRSPDSFYEHCSSTGVFGQIESSNKSFDAVSLTEKNHSPDWLISHVKANIEMLHDYLAVPLRSVTSSSHSDACLSILPRASIIWTVLSPWDRH